MLNQVNQSTEPNMYYFSDEIPQDDTDAAAELHWCMIQRAAVMGTLPDMSGTDEWVHPNGLLWSDDYTRGDMSTSLGADWDGSAHEGRIYDPFARIMVTVSTL